MACILDTIVKVGSHQEPPRAAKSRQKPPEPPGAARNRQEPQKAARSGQKPPGAGIDMMYENLCKYNHTQKHIRLWTD